MKKALVHLKDSQSQSSKRPLGALQVSSDGSIVLLSVYHSDRNTLIVCYTLSASSCGLFSSLMRLVRFTGAEYAVVSGSWESVYESRSGKAKQSCQEIPNDNS